MTICQNELTPIITSPSDRIPMTNAPTIVPPIVPLPAGHGRAAEDSSRDRVKLEAFACRGMRGHQFGGHDEADDRRAKS